MLTKTTPALSLARTLAALAGLAASAAQAQTFTESGDALQLVPGTLAVGAGALTRINGTLGANTDADLYAIRITDPAAFSASTASLTPIDTQLFLFDVTGRGVVFNDDISAAVTQSTITNQLVTMPGVYFLLITAYDNDPTANAGAIWTDTPYTGQRVPNGPGATGVMTGYSLNGGSSGPYGIALTGAEFFINTTAACPPNMNLEQLFSVGDGPSDIATGDFNFDGRIDVVTCNYNSHTTSLRFGNGDGTLASAYTFANGSANPRAIAVADFNRDGRLDLVTANLLGNNVTVRLGNGSAERFSGTASHYFAGNAPEDVAAADVNSDGIPDIVVANHTGPNIAVLIGNGAGNGLGAFAAPVTFSTTDNPNSLALADVDLDGRPDAVVGTITGIRVLRGNANGTFQAAVTAAPVGAENVTVGDINLDGKPDLASVNYNTDSLTIILGTGDINAFQAPVNYATEDGPASVVIGDINHDGKPDVIVGHGLAYYTQFFLGTGGGALQTTAFTGLGGAGREALADLNADGRLDIVGAIFPADTVITITQNPTPDMPTILAQPAPQAVLSGQGAIFSVALDGSLLPETLRWRRNGVPLFNNPTTLGVTTNSLTILDTALADNGAVFDCVVSNTCGSITTLPVSLTVSSSCTADFNRDGNLNSQDFFDFLTAFFAGCP